MKVFDKNNVLFWVSDCAIPKFEEVAASGASYYVLMRYAEFAMIQNSAVIAKSRRPVQELIHAGISAIYKEEVICYETEEVQRRVVSTLQELDKPNCHNS